MVCIHFRHECYIKSSKVLSSGKVRSSAEEIMSNASYLFQHTSTSTGTEHHRKPNSCSLGYCVIFLKISHLRVFSFWRDILWNVTYIIINMLLILLLAFVYPFAILCILSHYIWYKNDRMLKGSWLCGFYLRKEYFCFMRPGIIMYLFLIIHQNFGEISISPALEHPGGKA